MTDVIRTQLARYESRLIADLSLARGESLRELTYERRAREPEVVSPSKERES